MTQEQLKNLEGIIYMMLDRDKILKRTGDGLHVFRHYISGSWTIAKTFRNPLYDDHNASCNIYLDRKTKVYRMKDFGNDHYSGDCFHIVGIIKGLNSSMPHDFVEILRIINNEMNLRLEDRSLLHYDRKEKKNRQSSDTLSTKNNNEEISGATPAPKTKEYDYVAKPFSTVELELWSSYGITLDVLQKFKVKSIEKYHSVSQNGKHYHFNSQINEPIFGYVNPAFIKLYKPLSTLRFAYGGTMPEYYCFGLEQLPAKSDLLFIVGGEKDVMAMYAKGFAAICFNSETSNISPNIIDKLTYRFKHIILMYDVDRTGLDSSLKHQQRLSEYGVLRLVLPLAGTKEEKDISDFFRLGNSAKSLRKIFADMLSERYSNTIAILNSCKVSLELAPPESEVIVSINDVPLGTNGNLLCVTGGEGTGKSNFVGALIAGALNTNAQEIDTLGVSIKANRENKPILLYDTEQSQAQVFKNSNNIIRRAKCTDIPNEFEPYGFASLSRNVRLVSIVESMDLFYHRNNGIHLVIIDGIADLISGANNEAESINIVEQLYRLASIYNTCIVCVLHFIPNGLKLRGHLGSELQRKAAAIISIERDGDTPTSLIKALKVRDGSPLDVPIIKFAWDKEKQMHCYIGEKQKAERKRIELGTGAKEIFSKQPNISKKELIEAIKNWFSIKDTAARNYLECMLEEEIIVNDPSNPNYYMIGIKKTKN